MNKIIEELKTESTDQEKDPYLPTPIRDPDTTFNEFTL